MAGKRIASYCHSCHAAHMRRTRPTHSQLKPEQRLRANARAYARTYLSRGKIQQLPCQYCGSADSQMHHPDYTKPLGVEFVCRPCHEGLHYIAAHTGSGADRSKLGRMVLLIAKSAVMRSASVLRNAKR
jgi:hypothetical protein